MNITYIPFVFYYYWKTLFTLRVSLLLSSLNDASVDIIDDECSFEFFPKSEFTSPLYVYITHATDTEVESQHFAHFLEC